jgi:hypothetical protein
MLSDLYVQKMFKAFFTLEAAALPSALEIRLYEGPPSLGGAEVTGGSYAPMEPTFVFDDPFLSVRLDAPLVWLDMPAVTIYYVAVVDQADEVIIETPLVSPYTTVAGDSFTLADLPNLV